MEEEHFEDAESTPEYEREKRAKEVREAEMDAEAYNGLVMGAGDNDYLMRGRYFEVLRNVSARGYAAETQACKG
jgi:hypothetical protein